MTVGEVRDVPISRVVEDIFDMVDRVAIRGIFPQLPIVTMSRGPVAGLDAQRHAHEVELSDL
jgi:hypothetical protein